MKNTNFVTASELGEYVYCPRAWWLRANGFLPSESLDMSKGIAQHDALHNQLTSFNRNLVLALIFIGMGIAIFLIYLSITYFF